MTFDAVILAGGSSSRMGRDKALLLIDGQTLLARQVAVARNAGAGEIYISSRAEADHAIAGCTGLRDRFPEAGPLAGIECALARTNAVLLLVLAVDLPHMTATFLRELNAVGAGRRGVIPRVAGLVEPLAAFYPKIAWPLAEAAVKARENSVSSFAESCVRAGDAEYRDLESRYAPLFSNWNTPQDVQT